MTLDYVFHHVEQAVALMRNRGDALDRMDITSDGFWRSFSAILFSFPALFFTWVITGKRDQLIDPGLSLANLIAKDAVVEIAMWILPMLVYLFLLQLIGYGNRFAPLIIARNWAMVAINYLTALIFVPALFGSGEGVLGLVLLIALIVILTGLTNLTRQALNSGFALAAALVIGEFFIVTALSLAAYAGSGASPS